MNGVTKHERRHSGFKPDLLTIVEKDVSVDHIIGSASIFAAYVLFV